MKPVSHTLMAVAVLVLVGSSYAGQIHHTKDRRTPKFNAGHAAKKMVEIAKRLRRAEDEFARLDALPDSLRSPDGEDWRDQIGDEIYPESIFILEFALSYDSTNVDAHFLLGDTYLQLGRGVQGNFDSERINKALMHLTLVKQTIDRKDKWSSDREKEMYQNTLSDIYEIEEMTKN